MGYFSFPHTRTYDSDLGWLIKHLKGIDEKLDEYLENSVITFADPIQWNITEQYTALTMVIDSDGTAYLSKQPVPAGVDISNTDYWMPIFNYDDNINQLRSQIAYNAGNTNIIDIDLHENDLVWYQGYIYRVLYDLVAGSALIENVNIEAYTVDEKINQFVTDIQTVANNLANEIIDRENADLTLQGNIDTERDARIYEDGVINGLITNINNRLDNLKKEYAYPEDYGAVGDGVTDDTAAIQSALDNAEYLPVRFTKTYLVTDTIIVPSNTAMIGIDDATIIDGKPADTGFQASSTFYLSGVDNVFIKNLTFKGPGATNRYVSKYLIFGQSSSNITIVDSRFYDYNGVGCVYMRGCNYVYVYKCIVKEYTRGAIEFVEATSNAGVFYSSIINGRETYTSNRFPIMLNGYDQEYDQDNPATSGSNLYAIGNYITDDAPWWEGIDAHGGTNLFIADNNIVNIACPIAVFTNMNRGFRADNAFIHDNNAVGTMTNTNNPPTRYGSAFGGNNFFIHDNRFRFGGYAYPDSMSAGVYFDKGVNLYFHNNQISNSMRCAMLLSGEYNGVVISDNDINGVYGDEPTKYGIEFYPGSILGRIEIKNNRFEGAMTHVKAINSGNATQLIRLDNNIYIGQNPTFENYAYISMDKTTASYMSGNTTGRNGDLAINTGAGTPLWLMKNSDGYNGNWLPFGNMYIGAAITVSAFI